MDLRPIKKEWNDIVKGVVSVIIVSLIFNAITYVGAHIPQILAWISQVATATATIKLTRR